MGAVPGTRPITVADFEKRDDDRRLELIDGQILERNLPTKKHRLVQRRLFLMLSDALPHMEVFMELEFRPMPEYSMPIADVAAVSRDRWNSDLTEEYLLGAPDLVVEVISRSNTVLHINRKRRVCLENGAVQFWMVDADAQTVLVFASNHVTRECAVGELLSLSALGGDSIALAEIFVGL